MGHGRRLARRVQSTPVTPSEFEAAMAPALWRGIGIGAALAAVGAVLLVRQRREPPLSKAVTPPPPAIYLLIFIAIGVRLTALTRPFGTDEAATFLFYASKPLKIGMTVYGSPNNHPLHTALMHIAWLIFGDAEWALRLPALLAGVALVPLTWLASRSLLAAVLVAGAPVLIDYSTDARGYAIVCACALVVFNTRRPLVFAMATAIGFFTVPVMLYPFVAISVWALLTRRLSAWTVIASLLFTAALYAPMLSVSGLSAITSNAYVRPMPLALFVKALPKYALDVGRVMFDRTLILGIVIVAAAVARARAAAWAGVGAVLVVLVAQRVLPFPRVWLPFVPLLFILAASWWRWPRFETIAAIVVALTLATLWLVTPRPRDTGELPGVVDIARELKLRVRPGDAVLAGTPSDLPLAFYFAKLAVPADVLNPDVARANRVFVVCNRAYGMTLPRTLASLRIDLRGFVTRRVDERGAAEIVEMVRQR